LMGRSVYTASTGVKLEAVALMHDHSDIDQEVAMELRDLRGLLAWSAHGGGSGGYTRDRMQQVHCPSDRIKRQTDSQRVDDQGAASEAGWGRARNARGREGRCHSKGGDLEEEGTKLFVNK